MPYKDPSKRAEKQKEYSKRYYENNKNAQKERVRRNNERYRQEFYTFKSRLKCIKCGESHPAALDFHHHSPNPKNKKINELINNRQYNKAIEEIQEKCVVLCSNCHRKHHWEDRKEKPHKVARGACSDE